MGRLVSAAKAGKSMRTPVNHISHRAGQTKLGSVKDRKIKTNGASPANLIEVVKEGKARKTQGMGRSKPLNPLCAGKVNATCLRVSRPGKRTINTHSQVSGVAKFPAKDKAQEARDAIKPRKEQKIKTHGKNPSEPARATKVNNAANTACFHRFR